ncbi:fasciclin domain-containing protein [Modestobacter sp. SSW1-42]|uniref:fasciclin domain-containing protein n=1 Tax=Modestobacter sp. SSW1-42 TaxID=596372 RepID=UPI00398779C6
MKAPRLPRATAWSRVVGAAAVPVLLAGLAGCTGSGDDPAAAAAGRSATASAAPTPPARTGPVGPGCAMFPADGPGSPAALATTPVAGAVGTNPQLSTLTSAVLAANLVDAVNSRQDITVLAPSNAAFDALGTDALPALLADVPRLTTVLTHHVIAGRLTPDQLPGQHRTLNGDTVTVAGPADAPTVAAEQTLTGSAPAALVCGDVPTANATVYVIDQVLTPAA